MIHSNHLYSDITMLSYNVHSRNNIQQFACQNVTLTRWPLERRNRSLRPWFYVTVGRGVGGSETVALLVSFWKMEVLDIFLLFTEIWYTIRLVGRLCTILDPSFSLSACKTVHKHEPIISNKKRIVRFAFLIIYDLLLPPASHRGRWKNTNMHFNVPFSLLAN